MITSPRSVVSKVKAVCPVDISPTGALVKLMNVSVFAFARDDANLIWLSANPFAVVAAMA